MGGSGAEPLAMLAAEQGGAVSRAQLLALGFTSRRIDAAVSRGTLHRIHPSVYAVGHPTLTAKGWLMAAVLAGGPGAVVSHRSAAWWLELGATQPAKHHVTPTRHRTGDHVHFHECRLHPDEITVHQGAPVTTVARTLLDLAEVAPPRQVERALDAAERRRVFDLREVEAVLARANGRRGVRPLRHVLATHAAGSTFTRSELEERALAEIRAAGLPRPEVNLWLHGVEIDLFFRAARVAVELDGDAFHRTRTDRRRDRRRDVALHLRGITTLRFGWEEVVSGELTATLGRALEP